MKRLLDILASAAGLLVLSPLFLCVAAAIFLDSGLPVLYSQQRVGRGFKQFRLFKFRSMRVQSSGPAVTVAGDTRVTRIGKVLRSAKIDELPQFWNVLCGEMSLVGPRPEVPEYVEFYKDRYRSILSVRPGITDLASIHFRNEEAILAASNDPLRDYRERVLPIKLDLADEYIRTQTTFGDVSLIVRTAIALLHRVDTEPVSN
jgi:lipopolysaccharide/colanic/teichoic acid biosynthesis glycosyltransferase